MIPFINEGLHKLADGTDQRRSKQFAVFIRAVERCVSSERFKKEIVEVYEKSRAEWLTRKLDKLRKQNLTDQLKRQHLSHPVIYDVEQIGTLAETEYTLAS